MKRGVIAMAGGAIAFLLLAAYGIVQAGWWVYGPSQKEWLDDAPRLQHQRREQRPSEHVCQEKIRNQRALAAD